MGRVRATLKYSTQFFVSFFTSESCSLSGLLFQASSSGSKEGLSCEEGEA